MKVYIIDAYNVIHKSSGLARFLDQSLKASRDALMELCVSFKQRRGDVKKVVLAFDGNSNFNDLPQESYAGLEIVYTETGEDADDRILEILEGIGRTDHAYVVSDDNCVRNHARAYRATPVSVSAFYSEITKTHRRRVSAFSTSKKVLSAAAAKQVTEEYRRLLGL